MPNTSRKKTKIEQYIVLRVKEKRLERGMTQMDLAYELDVSEGFISQAESPKFSTHYNVEHINKLARVFKCSLHYFLPEKPI